VLVCHTVSQKNIPAIISRSLVKHYPILIIFGRRIPEKLWLEDDLISHLIAVVSALPGKTQKCKFDPFSCYYISVLVLDTKMCEIFGLERRSFYH